jgi:uncharacterized protein DUF6496
MPEKEVIERARKKKRRGDSPSTQAGEFVREEIHHVREGKHGARSTKQAIAIGLSKARRAGVKLGPSPSGHTTKASKSAPSPRRSRAVRKALEKEPHRTASSRALSRQAHGSAVARGPKKRRAAARKAARTRERHAA